MKLKLKIIKLLCYMFGFEDYLDIIERKENETSNNKN